jgi:uncharacterized protein
MEVLVMKSRLIASGGEKTYVLIFETGDEFVFGLQSFAEENRLAGSHFTAIGAFQSATLGYFDWQERKYIPIEIREQVEVLILAGDIALQDGKPKLHAHVVVGKRDGSAHGGHILKASVRPTLEVVLSESPQHLRRVDDPDSGIAPIQL